MSVRPGVDISRKTIRLILDMKMPCEEAESEFLCDECVFNIVPTMDCGLDALHDRALKVRKEFLK